ncbi:hypothetical protein E9529_04600 [Blastococcus sp. KM273128]|nr:hypothetical protein [Blastococcus sp. KM273128]
MQVAEGFLVAHLGDVALVEVEPLEERLRQQPSGGVPGGLEELLRLVQQAQCSRQRLGPLGQVLLDGV